MTAWESFVTVANTLANLFEKTVFVKSPYLDAMIANLEASGGIREDYIRLVLALLISYPLAVIQSFLHSPKVKKVFSIIAGISILQFCFGVGWIHAFISGMCVWLIMKFCNPRKQPIYVFVFSLLYLSMSFLYTIITDYMSYALDSTTYQMMLISRFQMLAWAVRDGTIDRQEVDEGAKREDRWGRIYRRRQAEYVDSVPDLIDYFGFVFHFPGLLGGPNTYYREYQDVMNNIRYESGKIPSSRWSSVAVNFVKGVLFFVMYIVASIYLPTDVLYEDSFHARSLLYRVFIIYITYVGVRFRYYGLWKLGEGICICNGFGERQLADGKSDWNGISNVDLMSFETSHSFAMATRLWNMRTQKWLQMCIYERSNFNQLYVYMVSAFWHGFYPAYYIGFLYGSVLHVLNRQCTVKLWPRVQGTRFESLYTWAGTFCVFTLGSFMLEAMFSYTADRAFLAWKQASYFGLTIIPVAFVVLALIPKVKKDKKDLCVCSKQMNRYPFPVSSGLPSLPTPQTLYALLLLLYFPSLLLVPQELLQQEEHAYRLHPDHLSPSSSPHLLSSPFHSSWPDVLPILKDRTHSYFDSGQEHREVLLLRFRNCIHQVVDAFTGNRGNSDCMHPTSHKVDTHTCYKTPPTQGSSTE